MKLENGKKAFAILRDPPRLVWGTLVSEGLNHSSNGERVEGWHICYTAPHRHTVWVDPIETDLVYEDQDVAERAFTMLRLRGSDDS